MADPLDELIERRLGGGSRSPKPDMEWDKDGYLWERNPTTGEWKRVENGPRQAPKKVEPTVQAKPPEAPRINTLPSGAQEAFDRQSGYWLPHADAPPPKVKEPLSPEDVALKRSQVGQNEAQTGYYGAQTDKIRSELSNQVIEQQRQRIADALKLGQIDQKKAEVELDNIIKLAGQIFQSAPYQVPEGSEFFPHLGPGSSFARLTGGPAKTGGTFNPIQQAQGAMGRQGMPPIPGMEQVLASGMRAYDQAMPPQPPPMPQQPPAPMRPPLPQEGGQMSGPGVPAPDIDAILQAAAQRTGLGDEGIRVAKAILQTEGGLTGKVGDNGNSYGAFQFHREGMLPSFAQQLGMSLDEAGELARTNPVEAINFALNGYLGEAIKKGMAQGLRGPALATFAQRYGQRSKDPERAGSIYSSLYGG